MHDASVLELYRALVQCDSGAQSDDKIRAMAAQCQARMGTTEEQEWYDQVSRPSHAHASQRIACRHWHDAVTKMYSTREQGMFCLYGLTFAQVNPKPLIRHDAGRCTRAHVGESRLLRAGNIACA